MAWSNVDPDSGPFPWWGYVAGLLFLWLISGVVHVLVGWHYQAKDKEARWTKWKAYVEREKQKQKTKGASASATPTPVDTRRSYAAAAGGPSSSSSLLEEVFDSDSESEWQAPPPRTTETKHGFQIF